MASMGLAACGGAGTAGSATPVPVPGRAAIGRLAGGRGVAGFGVWREGVLVEGHGIDERLPSLSITKTVAALAAMRAVDEGWFEPDGPVAPLFPEWRDDRAKQRITVRMLVNQCAGLAAGDAELYRGRVADKGAVAAVLPVVDPPGTRFRYGPAPWELLAELMRRRLDGRGSSIEMFLERHLGRLGGLGSPRWRADAAGRPYFSTGAEFSIGELGRLGQVVARLARGESAGGVGAVTFRDLTAAGSANPMVASGIWWNRNAAERGATSVEPERVLDGVRPPAFWRRACLAPAADPGWLALVGSGGKRVYVLPAHGIVVVRLARDPGWSDAAFFR